jgi:polyphenol oxidase
MGCADVPSSAGGLSPSIMTSPGVITIPQFAGEARGIMHAFGTKAVSTIPANNDGTKFQVVSVNQVHGVDVLILAGPLTDSEVREAASARNYDAIITDRPRTWLTVRTADCVPVLFLGPDRGVIGVAHAGWRGTVGGIAAKVVRLMQEVFGCSLDLVQAAIGPSIGRCCYEVDEPVLGPLKRGFPFWAKVVSDTGSGRGHLDLGRSNRLALETAGVQPSHIFAVNLCTACHPDLFHSYRRDGKGTRHMFSGIARVQ